MLAHGTEVDITLSEIDFSITGKIREIVGIKIVGDYLGTVGTESNVMIDGDPNTAIRKRSGTRGTTEMKGSSKDFFRLLKGEL